MASAEGEVGMAAIRDSCSGIIHGEGTAFARKPKCWRMEKVFL